MTAGSFKEERPAVTDCRYTWRFYLWFSQSGSAGEFVAGDITCSIRIWIRPHVRGGGRYRMGEGEIEVDSIESIGFPDITPQLAREFGLLGVLDLLKVAKHGRGESIYLARFHYIPPRLKQGRAGVLKNASKRRPVRNREMRPV